MGYKDKEKQRQYQWEWMKKKRDAWLAANGPCASCQGTTDLQVDHMDRTKKVSHNVWSWTPARREAELAKCQVLCKKCHLEKTIIERRPPHGTNNRYTGPLRCRCAACKAAHATANSAYR